MVMDEKNAKRVMRVVKPSISCRLAKWDPQQRWRQKQIYFNTDMIEVAGYREWSFRVEK